MTESHPFQHIMPGPYRYAVLIEGANGVFKVGETCAKKIDKYEPTIAKKAREDGNLRRLTRKNAATESAFDEAVDRLESDSSFKAQPHPKGWPGKTLHDYLAWYKDNAGKAKFVQVFKLATK